MNFKPFFYVVLLLTVSALAAVTVKFYQTLP